MRPYADRPGRRQPLGLRLLFCALLCLPAMAAAADNFGRLLEDYWQWRLETQPELATYLGDRRYNDRLTDLSAPALAARRDKLALVAGELAKLVPAAGEDAITYAMLTRELELERAGERFKPELLALNQMFGPHSQLPELFSLMPTDDEAALKAYLARLAAVPALLAQQTALLRTGMAQGIVGYRESLAPLPGLIDALIAPKSAEERFAGALRKSSAPGAAAARAEADKIVREKIVPAFASLRDFLRDQYLPACRTAPSIASLPGGAERYRQAIRFHTTLELEPAAVHALGLAEVARIRGEMLEVARAKGYADVDAFQAALRRDPRQHFSDEEEMLQAYRAAAKRADMELPRLFATLPRAPYGVMPVPAAAAAAQSGGYYVPSAADGSRAGVFYINTHEPASRPRYGVMALTLHESVPGHHLQIASAQEIAGLHPYRRNYWSTAYIEGWGLYAESLGEEMGFYQDPYARFGRLEMEMWRAARLVVDTGLHALDWSRQRAIDYLLAHTAMAPSEAAVEIDRYIEWPGQALAYKLGELRIKALRDRARQALGRRFDPRRFHNQLLDQGPLPLPVLEQSVDRWIAAERF